MPSEQRSEISTLVARDLIDADLDAAFALLYAAETQGIIPDNRSHALRAIEEAQNVMRDGEKRLSSLSNCDRERLRVRLERMRGVIESVGATLRR
jgi:hypothetical protein